MPRPEMPPQRYCLKAAVQTHNVVRVDGSPDRYRRSSNRVKLGRLTQTIDRLMDSSNQLREFARRQLMMSEVPADDLRREMMAVVRVGVHAHSKEVFAYRQSIRN